jgi:23S rRNA pseudouridine1911/1915/1917 synthase
MPPAGNKYSMVFQNEDMLVVDKPSGLLSIPDRQQSEVSLKELLQKQFGDIIPVHRLDKDTSGLIVFARNADFHRYLSMLFEKHQVEKYYLGLVSGCPKDPSGEIIAPIAEHLTRKGMMTVHRSGKPSHTGYEVLESNPSFSLVLFRLHTGRTHQIRVHAKHIGHPIICDPLYGDGKPVFLSAFKKGFKLGKFSEDKPLITRLALHAARLVFDDHGTRREFEAPVPKEFRVLMKQLGA